jgi:hypothetical protein
LDGFDVVAPSTPAGPAFDIVVKALQGPDDRMTNRYLVRNYRGTIRFASTDPDATLPADYTFTNPDRGFHRFRVTLPSAGVHTVSVQEVGSQKTGVSNAIVVGKEFDDTEKHLYWGVLQQHTNIGGHAAQTPQYAFTYGRDVSLLDFLTLTEHCKDHYNFDYSTSVADDFYSPGTFVTFPGIEWSDREDGHRHVVYLDPVIAIPPCSNPSHPDHVFVATLAQLLAISRNKPELVIVHHTGWRYTAPYRSTDNVVLGNIGNTNQRLFEVFSHHGSSEKWDNAPYTQHNSVDNQWGPDKKVFFQDAMARGYRFGVTAGTDNHTGEPGGNTSPRNHYSRTGITAVYADELTREGIWEALWARRTYGTTGARILLDFRIDGHVMGEEFETDQNPTLSVDVTGTNTLALVQIQRNGYDTVFEVEPDAATATFEYTDDTTLPGETYSYYVRVVQGDQHLAWSSPIWVNRRNAPPLDEGTYGVVTYPNPFNPSVTVLFSLPDAAPVTVKVWSVDAKPVATLANAEHYGKGIHEVPWNGLTTSGAPAASGIYFVSVTSKFGAQTTRTVLVR